MPGSRPAGRARRSEPPPSSASATLRTWEIRYNHFNTRLGLALPLSKRIVEEKVRPSGVNYFIAWETFTHALMGSTGLP